MLRVCGMIGLPEEDLGRFRKIYKDSMDNLRLVCEKDGEGKP
jgi:hypothetical protein